ncbi:uncharacterized protein MELLADRAFT_124507 [Melampsora larici-populina 98AG31]|uniref:Secreted protein n=1 Tax=Melampsora larici-populina (strain 98AG31 / pathotype 3-4-7) TaxID=747676 RepID=F4RUN0_MELLP|nr:uncharacterized protein MELLADRAFT_124507 [Melampsora larici-populina 98AG31]EGG03966.1 secreted protein [Melampsora larici-populina 98AG31]
MNLSIIATIFVIFVSVNQSFGAMIKNSKSEKGIISADEALVNVDVDMSCSEMECQTWCQSNNPIPKTCNCGSQIVKR